MNIFSILKSRTGAVNKTALLMMMVSMAIAVLTIYNYITDTPAAEQRKIRTLADIISSGEPIPPEYSGIRISVGSTQLANATERAAMEGSLFDGGEGAIAALNGLNGVSGQKRPGAGSPGDANASLAGLDASLINGGLSGADGQVTFGAGEAEEAAAMAGSQLQRAAIASVGGHDLGTGSSGGFGGSSANRGGQSGTTAAGGESPNAIMGSASINGSMPGGDALVVASASMQGGRPASYVPGSRTSRFGMGSLSKDGKSLREIAVHSGKVAANRYRAANDGSDPFMSDQNLSSGLTVDDALVVDIAGTEDDSFEDDLNQKGQDLDDDLGDIDTTETDKTNARNRLLKSMVGLFLATFAGMMTIQSLMSDPTPWNKVAAFAVAGVLAGAIGVFLADVINNADKDHVPATVAFSTAAAVMLTGIGLSFSKQTNQWIGKATKFFEKSMGTKLLAAVIFGTGVSYALDGTIDSIKSFSEDDSGDGLSNG